MLLFNKKNSLLTRLSSIFLVLMLMCFISFSIFYLHTHLDRNGHLVTHSHPFDKTNQNNHSHTQFDFLHYSMFSIFEGLFFFILVLLIIILSLKRIFDCVCSFVLPESIILSFYSNRAPPLLSL